MTTALLVSYNTSANSHAASSYQISMAETDDAVTGRLQQHGDTYNNIVNYAGVFATRGEAVKAALDYISASVRILELDTAGDRRIVLQRWSSPKLRLDEYTTARILGSKSRNGTFIAAD